MPRQLSIAVVMDPIDTIIPSKDSTFALLLAGQQMGLCMYYSLPDTLRYDAGAVKADLAAVEVDDDTHDWYRLGAISQQDLANFDVILIRNEPPFDRYYLYLTQLLQIVEQQGVTVINRPQALQSMNEKLALLNFPQYAPKCLVSSQKTHLMQFIDNHHEVVIKPLDGMGGQGIFYLTNQDCNRVSALELLTQGFTQPIMAQRYISAIREGDKRIFILNGEVFPYSLVRLPKQGETRANMAVGGRVDCAPLTSYEQQMANRIAKDLAPKGLLLIGLDVIGGYLTEVNVTCPTGMRELTYLTGINVAKQFLSNL